VASEASEGTAASAIAAVAAKQKSFILIIEFPLPHRTQSAALWFPGTDP
jgi:hypothetical protein